MRKNIQSEVFDVKTLLMIGVLKMYIVCTLYNYTRLPANTDDKVKKNTIAFIVSLGLIKA